MKKSTIKFSRYLLTIFCSIITTAVNAQKLPTVQKTGIWVPGNLKVDGNANEWGKFLAYNNSTDVYYSMANDGENLYLIIQATDPVIIKKIIGGGISFTINKPGKKKTDDGICITYPVFNSGNRPYIIFEPKYLSGATSSSVKADSLASANNNRLAGKAKEIKVAGISTMDTLVSIYNTDGIKAAQLLDSKMAYTYELAIALKHLNRMIDENGGFIYNIRLNEVKPQDINGLTVIKGVNGAPGKIQVRMGAVTQRDITESSSPTDFWGAYTLVKK